MLISVILCFFSNVPEVKDAVKTLMALAFLPRMLLRINFSIIEGLEVVQETPALSELVLYHKSTWLDGNFTPKLWNVHSSSMRTNNMVEGWHSKLNKRLRKSHPNIYELINYLKKEQGKTELTVSQTRLGAPAQKRKKKYRQLEGRIQSLTTQHKEGRLSAQEFLYSIRHVVHEF